MFPAHSIEDAPQESRSAMRAVAEQWGGAVPDAAARMAASPALLKGFLALNAGFERCTLDPLAREVVVLAVAVRNQCQVCVAIHRERLHRLGADPGLVTALQEHRPLADERLEAVRAFTLDLLATAGAASDEAVKGLLAHGYTERNALEVVLGIGTYTLSTFANRLTRAV